MAAMELCEELDALLFFDLDLGFCFSVVSEQCGSEVGSIDDFSLRGCFSASAVGRDSGALQIEVLVVANGPGIRLFTRWGA